MFRVQDLGFKVGLIGEWGGGVWGLGYFGGSGFEEYFMGSLKGVR